ncbi:MAG: response regulator transcription factor [Chloroflexota bacterium]
MEIEYESIRVLLADDQRLIREGIASLLSIQPGIEIVGTAIDGEDALRIAHEQKPDVVLMDIRMPEMDGIDATKALMQRHPTCRVLMLTTFDDEEYIVKALRAGAVGYLLKDLPPKDLAQAIRLAHSGIFQLDPSVAGKLVGALAPSVSDTSAAKPAETFDLSLREREVLKLLAAGATNREIADTLIISLGTVKNHVSNILGRLELRDRVQAAIFARENNLD